MSTSFEAFEFYEGGRTDSRAPRITVRRSGQLALTGAAIALLGEDISHVQIGYDSTTRAVGIRPAAEGVRGRYKLRRMANRSGLVDGRRFFAHHGLTVGEARTFDAEDFGKGIVGFRLSEAPAAEGEAGKAEAPAAEAKPARGGKRKGAAA
jgi:hypothetical protein